MPKTSVADWDTTAANNTDINSIPLAENQMYPRNVNNAFREMMAQVASATRRGSDLATAATLNLDSVDSEFLDLTGTTTVTAVTLTDTQSRRARAVGAFQITASASLVVNGSTTTSYTTTAGDLLFFEGYGSSVVRVWSLGGSVASATTSQAGIVELATDAEAQAKTDTARSVTPSNLAALGASDTQAGFIEIATQAEQETGTDTLRAVVPGRQQFHPSAAKFWAYVTVSGGTPTLQSSYNVTSITDTGVGQLTITIATDFSSTNWAPVFSVNSVGLSSNEHYYSSVSAGSVLLTNLTVGVAAVDPNAWSIAGYGDQ